MVRFHNGAEAVGLFLVLAAMLYGCYCTFLFLKAWLRGELDPEYRGDLPMKGYQFNVALAFVLVAGCGFFSWLFGIDFGTGIAD